MRRGVIRGFLWELIVVYMGTHENSMDDKGRVVLPIPFRSPDVKSFVVMLNVDLAIRVYTEEAFRAMASRVQQKIHETSDPRLRRIWGSIAHVNIDATHRFMIPDVHRSYALIATPSRVVLLGTGSHFEVWSHVEYYKYAQQTFKQEIVGPAAEAAGVPEIV